MSSKIEFAPYLHVKNAMLPAFSHDGTRLFYLTEITGTYQVWSVPVEGGWADQLTFFDDRVMSIEAAPDGEGLALVCDSGGNEMGQLYVLRGAAEQGVTITPIAIDPKVKHNFGTWSPDGKQIAFASNRRKSAHFDIYVQPADGGEAKLVYEADRTLHPLAWSHSGRYLLIDQINTNLDSDLYLLDLQQLDTAPRLLTPHTGTVRFEQATFSDDERGIYVITDKDRDFAGLAYLDLQTLDLRWLASPEWDVQLASLSPHGTQIAYTINEGGCHKLALLELESGVEKGVADLPPGAIQRLVWSTTGDQLAFDFTSPIHNFDVWIYDLRTDRLWQTTHSPRGGLDPQSFVMPTLIEYTSFDGLKISALWYLPQNAQQNGSLPVVVYIHGGPESQMQFTWNAIFQYFLARGYAVFAPNVRGSSGYGKHYLSLDDVRKRMDSVADLKYAHEWLAQSGYADPKKIAVYGGSYGGFMVLSAITVYPELWAAAVDIVGIANLITFLEKTSSYRRHLRISEYGDPEKDRDFLISISPIHKADRIAAPLMVIHGAQDPRVPVGEAEQIVEMLHQRHHPVEYQRFEDEGHGIVKIKNRLVCFPKVGDFLDTYLASGNTKERTT